MEIGFNALWKLTTGQSSGHIASAAIFFVNSSGVASQLKYPDHPVSSLGSVQYAVLLAPTTTNGNYVELGTRSTGLASAPDPGAAIGGSDAVLVTTGMIVGLAATSATTSGTGTGVNTLEAGTVKAWLAADTYDIQIRYRSDDNVHAVTVKERHLWVESRDYPIRTTS
jgi:hypothetical protein